MKMLPFTLPDELRMFIRTQVTFGCDFCVVGIIDDTLSALECTCSKGSLYTTAIVGAWHVRSI